MASPFTVRREIILDSNFTPIQAEDEAKKAKVERVRLRQEAAEAKRKAKIAEAEVEEVIKEVVVGMAVEDEEDMEKRPGCMRKLIDSTPFNLIVYLSIFLNCIVTPPPSPLPFSHSPCASASPHARSSLSSPAIYL